MLKNRKIGLLVEDPQLRGALYLAFVKAGAAVYPADSEAELDLLCHFDLDLLILAGDLDTGKLTCTRPLRAL